MTKKNLIDCHNRIKPFIHNTPVLTSNQINEMTGSEIFFKCDKCAYNSYVTDGV